MIERNTRRYLIPAVFDLLLLTCSALAQSMGLNLGIPRSVPSSGVCSQATTFLARTSGLSSPQTTAYQNLICGMVTDGTWSLMDGLWVFATNTTTTANLNLVSTSFGMTQVGTETFAANAGYTGDGTTGYFTTGYNPATAGGNFTQNSASLGECTLTTSAGPTGTVLGAQNSSTFITDSINPYNGGGSNESHINDANSTGGVYIPFDSLGSNIASRTSSASIVLYANGASVATITDASSAIPSLAFFIGAINIGGTASSFYGEQLGYVFSSSGLTGTQASNVYSRLHTFLTAVGAPSGC